MAGGIIGALIFTAIRGIARGIARGIKHGVENGIVKSSLDDISSYRVRIPDFNEYGSIVKVSYFYIAFEFDKEYRMPYYSIIDRIEVEDDPTGEKRVSLYEQIDKCRMLSNAETEAGILLDEICTYQIRLPGTDVTSRIGGFQNDGELIVFINKQGTFQHQYATALKELSVEDDPTGEKKDMLISTMDRYISIKTGRSLSTLPDKESSASIQKISSYKIKLPEYEGICSIASVSQKSLTFKYADKTLTLSIYAVIDKLTVADDFTGERKSELLMAIDAYRKENCYF